VLQQAAKRGRAAGRVVPGLSLGLGAGAERRAGRRGLFLRVGFLRSVEGHRAPSSAHVPGSIQASFHITLLGP